MTQAEKDLLNKAKKELIAKNIIVTPSITGGALV
jgi:hypothetical protein